MIPNLMHNVLIPTNGLTTEWHTYGVMRERNGIHFFLDGKHVRTIWGTQVPAKHYPGDKPLAMILSTGAYDWQYEGDVCKCPAPRDRKLFFEVDWARFYPQGAGSDYKAELGTCLK